MKLLSGFLDGLRPDPIMTVSEWADENRVLSKVASSEYGKWRTSRTPYLKDIMDALSSHISYQKVVFIKGSQVGGTEAGNNWVGYIIDNSPAPTLLVMPTEAQFKKNSKTRIDPMIEASPRLRDKVNTAESKMGKNTIDQKNFIGGVLFIVGANSPVGLSSTPIKNIFCDEIDRYPMDVNGEGSPTDLAEARTRTFSNRKIFLVSTPTVKDASAIELEFLKTDQRYYEVPCPYCGAMHVLQFENLMWDEGAPHTAYMRCPECEGKITERHKTEIFANGQWTAYAPDNVSAKTIGFHLSSFYSPQGWFSWADIADSYEKSKKSPEKMKVFVNTILGETYEEAGETMKWEEIYNKSRMEHNKSNSVNYQVCFLTAGVDVQKDRLELEIVGWCADKQSYSIDFRVLLGNTTLSEVWDELTKIVNETWTREDGVELPLKLMAIDTGYNTGEVHKFCRKYSTIKVIPIKGQDSLGLPTAPPRQIDYNRNGKKIGRLKQWNVGVSYLKGELYSWLQLQPNTDGTFPQCYCHFLQYDEKYFMGLVGEKYMPKSRKWVKVYERNEPLDCRIYARAAANVVGLDRMKPEQLMRLGNVSSAKPSQKQEETPKTNRKEKKKSDFWD